MQTGNEQRYRDFIHSRQGEFCTIEHHRFHINPDSVRIVTERVQLALPTRLTYVRFTYGHKPVLYQLDGMTGVGGTDELQALEQDFNRYGTDKLLHFTFPGRFRGVKKVYLNLFQDMMSNDLPLYNTYSIELVEYDETREKMYDKIGPTVSTGIARTPPSGPTKLIVPTSTHRRGA